MDRTQSVEVLSDRVVERYEAELADVRDVLSSLGFGTRRVSRISLRLRSNGIRGGGEGVVRPMAPGLLVYGPDGDMVAEVTVGAQSRSFLVSLPCGAGSVRPVPLDKPE
ncbi:hypothetical protein ACIBEJ_12735 [Nonomuraea sp. NPDC050790]|uniref:hypothetical protein n=1 Tax=Nonomuraea sp. NPDC050790 TaxID=3364371 RepID=UPI0037AABBC0